MSSVGEEIKRLRQAKGWTQEQLAVYAGSSQPTVNLLEAGKRNPSASTLEKLARALEVEVVDLFPKPPTPQPSLEDAAQSEALQEALAVLFRGLARRGRGIIEQSLREGPSEALSRELTEYYAETAAVHRIQGRRDIFGRDSDELAEAEAAYQEVADRIEAMLRQDVEASEEEHWRNRATAGRPSALVEARLIRDGGEEVPWDGTSTGELEVRGPWVARAYYRDEDTAAKFDDGWLRTGDMAAIDERGYIMISDRAKDVIKSGGEWISSVELEVEIMAHEKVQEAAVIATKHERWGERPLACVVLEPDVELTLDELNEHLAERVAKWWLPDELAIVDEVPKTSVGKFDKKVLRRQLEEGRLDTAAPRREAPPARSR